MKRMFLKGVSTLLSAAMLLSMTGCGAKEDPKAVLDAALTKNAEMSDSDMDLSMDLSVDQNGMSISIVSDGNMKISGAKYREYALSVEYEDGYDC